ncbi:DUF1810 domain-containing protein [Spongisporangium articulatum]|uniref:DUF1810 domain-containing protein n=1 Tax=Spongisporangium articulatum TaxID=3362603 RepID=A0ABW8AIE9_9ACTN
MTDEFDLNRFVEAQAGGVFERAVAEVRAGEKRSHWMWFVFPQVAGLGMSATSRRYAISGRAEAVAYLAHPVLGRRLLECCEAVAGLPPGTSAERVFGSVDALKLRSCLTLFETVSAEPVFGRLLDRLFGGVRDPATLERLT